jgi:hypothetical protein
MQLDRPSPQNNSRTVVRLEMARERGKASRTGSGFIGRSTHALRRSRHLCGRRRLAAERAPSRLITQARNLVPRIGRGADLRWPLGPPHLPRMSNANRIKSAVRGMPSFPLMTVHELAIAL